MRNELQVAPFCRSKVKRPISSTSGYAWRSGDHVAFVAMGMKEIRMVGVVGTKPASVNELMNSLVVMDKTSIKLREISLIAGTSKHEARLMLRSSIVQDQCEMKWTVIQQGAWAGRVSKDLRRSPVTTREICETTVHGPLDTVISFWKAVGFEVAYDVIKEGNQCRCHQDGFGVDIICLLSTRCISAVAVQIKDQRKGSLTKALETNAVIEASLRVAEDADVEAAERALLALSQRLDSVVKMSAAH